MTTFTFKDVILTSAQIQDFSDIADIYNEHIQLKSSTMEERVFDTSKIQEWVEAFNDREELLILKRGQLNIGWAIIKNIQTGLVIGLLAKPQFIYEAMKPEKAMVLLSKKALIERCKALNYHHLVAKIFAINTASIQYNLKLGYEIVGRQKEIGFKNGKWTDVVIMQYIIK